jgi:hypothetical protein
MPDKKWQKDKKQILKELGYPKLTMPLQTTLTAKSSELTDLY